MDTHPIHFKYYIDNTIKSIEIVALPQLWMLHPDVLYIPSLGVVGHKTILLNYFNEQELNPFINGYNYNNTQSASFNNALLNYHTWLSKVWTENENTSGNTVATMLNRNKESILSLLQKLPKTKVLDVSDNTNILIVSKSKTKVFVAQDLPIISSNYNAFVEAIQQIQGVDVYKKDLKRAHDFFNIKSPFNVTQKEFVDASFPLINKTTMSTIKSSYDINIPQKTLPATLKKTARNVKPMDKKLKDLPKDSLLNVSKMTETGTNTKTVKDKAYKNQYKSIHYNIISDNYDTLIEALKLIPAKEEYLKEDMEAAKAFFKK